MARSFFTGTDAELYNGSMAFSAAINQSPESYGLSEQACLDYAALNEAYAAAYMAAASPNLRTRPSVTGKNDAAAALRVAAANLAKIIGGQTNVSDAQRAGLGLNVRAAGSPLGPPGRPYGFRVELLADGSIRLSWKCDNPRRGAGTIYLVSRRTSPQGGFTSIGRTGKRKFIDATLPIGSTRITYRVQAIRSTAEGQPAEFNVSFGCVAPARAADAPPVKIAA